MSQINGDLGVILALEVMSYLNPCSRVQKTGLHNQSINVLLSR
jgi:hypothetical protein